MLRIKCIQIFGRLNCIFVMIDRSSNKSIVHLYFFEEFSDSVNTLINNITHNCSALAVVDFPYYPVAHCVGAFVQNQTTCREAKIIIDNQLHNHCYLYGVR